ncbi:N(5)-(carboxyethyl)ornithine synthase [Butyricimonas synergistica]|uniref:N(5)-(carboxyethyl)ornithine synthase n=1 Tax=Butyricimonas synergistica TaxID=544644 RepID=UPI0022E258C5|nr:N(5)-(carboxyethyl)ornithine synthase [Butyricimonas synergistica]
MKTVGLPISHKENEKRRALVLSDIAKIENKCQIFIETGYGEVLGIRDEDYIHAGVQITSRDDVLSKDIICDPKIGDADYLDMLNNQIIFGWVHAVQNRDITDKIIKHKLTSYAWEDMYEDGRHSFWRNNEIAGEAAVFHAYMCHGMFPYNTKAAVLGRGNIARGAIKTLNFMGAEVIQYDRKMEGLFRKELDKYDVIVNAILWDTSRKDHIIYKKDLKRMKRNALIIDIACDRNGGVESSIPTTIENPIYTIDGVTHYVVDHTPSLFWKTATESLSEEFVKYIDGLIQDQPDDVLVKARNFDKGVILDDRINKFQKR